MDLGEKLFELRKSKNLTQDDVAEKLNVTRQTVSKWETNQSLPDFDKILPLCELYEISADELLKGEKNAESNEDNKFNFDEAKKHLFERNHDDYENMTRNQINQKSAEVVSGSIFLFFLAIAFSGVGIAVLRFNPVVIACITLVLIGLGVTNIVKHYMSIPKLPKNEDEIKQDKFLNQIKDVVMGITVALYFIVSFTTMAWYITWVMFIIGDLIYRIIKLLYTIKGEEENE